MRRIEDDATVTYFVDMESDTEPGWVVVYERESGQLRTATRGTLTLYFDDVDGTRLIGGRAGGGAHDKGYWLVSFYPGKATPRLALSASGESADHLSAAGNVYAWDPSGKSLLEEEIEKARPIEVAVEEMGERLTQSEQTVLGWRGEQEAAYLLGTY
jgi:hypothetical protein